MWHNASEWVSDRESRWEGKRAVLGGRDGEGGADNQLSSSSLQAHLTDATFLPALSQHRRHPWVCEWDCVNRHTHLSTQSCSCTHLPCHLIMMWMTSVGV